jgi:hypothetical protein
MASILDLQQFAAQDIAMNQSPLAIIGKAMGEEVSRRNKQQEEQKALQLEQQMKMDLLQKKFEYDQQAELEKQNRIAQENERQNKIFEQLQGMDDRTASGDVKRVIDGGKGTEIQRKVSPIKRTIKRTMKDGIVNVDVTEEISNEPDVKPLSPILQNAKDKRLEDVVMTVQDYNVKRDALSDAVSAMDRIEGGRYGALNRLKMRELNPNSPALEDWQKLKIVLLDETLANTMKTKGAISDEEMKLFQRAAANDDIFSVRATLPVLRRALKKMNAEENAKVVSYRNLYKEDPYQLQGVESNISKYEDMFKTKDSNKKPMIDVNINSVGVGKDQVTPNGTTYRTLE